jgi:hypothetical protein
MKRRTDTGSFLGADSAESIQFARLLIFLAGHRGELLSVTGRTQQQEQPMNATQFSKVLSDETAYDSRRADAKDAIRAVVMSEPLPVLARNMIDDMRRHLDVLAGYIERKYDLDSEWA